MARNANENTPSADDVQRAVAGIEQCVADLASERGLYMRRCKQIRETMSGDYENAQEKGITRKLLKKIIRERELERKINALGDGLEPDETAEIEMLREKLGELANTPLGEAALAAAGAKTDGAQAPTGP